MLEQSTIKEGIRLAEAWGPSATIAALFLLSQIVYAFHVKKKAVGPVDEAHKEIDRLRNDKAMLFNKIHEVELQMKDRITFDWAEKQLIPKIENLGHDINKLTNFAEKLNTTLEAIADRLLRVESGR